MREQRCWVLDSSPAILFCKAEAAHLLVRLADRLVVPRQVLDEIRAGEPADPARRAFDPGGDLSEVEVVEPPPLPPELATASGHLGAGEAAVLAWATAHPGWAAVVDDRAARRWAAQHAVPVIGSLGVVILARQEGHIAAAGTVVARLLEAGLDLDQAMVQQVLRQALDEPWPPPTAGG